MKLILGVPAAAVVLWFVALVMGYVREYFQPYRPTKRRDK